MKTNDINLMKGKVKDAALTWVDAQIDYLLPNKAAGRSMLKNAANNILARYDEGINKGMDVVFLMFADKDSIHINLSMPVDCSEMQKQTLAFPLLRNHKLPLIPEGLIFTEALTDSRER